MCETFNYWILSARHKSIISILKDIKINIMNRIKTMEAFADTWVNDISLIAMDNYEKNTRIANKCKD